MNHTDLINILQEEQINKSIDYLVKKTNGIDKTIEDEMKILNDNELKLKELLFKNTEEEEGKNDRDIFSPICQSILVKNEINNDVINDIKSDIDKKKYICDEYSKEKKQLEIILKYLKTLEKIKEDSSIQTKKQENKEKQYLNLALQVFEAQENEKKRIARDLHDTTVQTLVSMIHKLELSMRVMDSDPIRTKLELQVLIQSLHTTINDMRSMIYDLRPMSVDDIGLVVTLERFAKQISMNNQEVEITLIVINDEIEFTSIVNLNILRVIQESCSNAIKSGKATKINITLKYEIDIFFITIVDNGCGFSYNDNVDVSTKNFGLSILKERISLLEGDVNIESKVGEGTIIKIEIPIEKNREINCHGKN